MFVSRKAKGDEVFLCSRIPHSPLRFEINAFDVFNRLKSTANEKGSASYKYKADVLRLSKTVNGVVTTKRIRFIY